MTASLVYAKMTIPTNKMEENNNHPVPDALRTSRLKPEDAKTIQYCTSQTADTDTDQYSVCSVRTKDMYFVNTRHTSVLCSSILTNPISSKQRRKQTNMVSCPVP